MTTKNHSKTLTNLFKFHRYLNHHIYIKNQEKKFEMRIKNQYQVIKSPPHELHNKYFWLKRQRMCGVQFELQFNCKTRLDHLKRVSPHITH
ncbi:hypothetical protein MKW92_007977 [Papaver armeniacum]|nr:hypothetical protein MKW92_007977 [Papaver armeniacum]